MKKAASTTKRTTSKKPKTEGLGVIGELDRYLFGEGRHYQLYHKLGAHPYTYRGQDGYYFAVWAPHAAAVSLVGDFNAWNPDATPMKPVADSGIYELFVPGLGVGQLYKFGHHHAHRNEFYLRQIHMHFRQNTVLEPLP